MDNRSNIFNRRRPRTDLRTLEKSARPGLEAGIARRLNLQSAGNAPL